MGFGEIFYVSLCCPGYNGKAAVPENIHNSGGGVLEWAVCRWARLVLVCVNTCTLTLKTLECSHANQGKLLVCM